LYHHEREAIDHEFEATHGIRVPRETTLTKLQRRIDVPGHRGEVTVTWGPVEREGKPDDRFFDRGDHGRDRQMVDPGLIATMTPKNCPWVLAVLMMYHQRQIPWWWDIEFTRR